MGILTSRRGKIRAHTHERLAQQAREQMEERLSGASGGASSIYDGRMGGLDASAVVQRERRRFASVHVPTSKLLLLAVYSAIVLLLSSPWTSSSPLFSRLRIAPGSLTAAGSALAGALTMVTGLLIGYRSNQALRKWERGREVWMVQLRSEVRDALRMISLIGPRGHQLPPRPRLLERKSSSESVESGCSPVNRATLLDQRSQELLALIVAFVFALQHHLDGTRPTLNVPSADPASKYPPAPRAPVDPLVDLLPLGYVASLRRTPARVRFADSDEEASSPSSDDVEANDTGAGTGTASALDAPTRKVSSDPSGTASAKGRRNGVAREHSRSPSPRTAAVRARIRSGAAGRSQLGGTSSDDGWAGEHRMSGQSSALAPGRAGLGMQDAGMQERDSAAASPARPASHREISIQLAQLNLPNAPAPQDETSTNGSAGPTGLEADPSTRSRRERPRNPVLSSRHPRNLPLAVLRLMQSYVDSFAQEGEKDKAATGRPRKDGHDGQHHADELPRELAEAAEEATWGWSASQAEKGWSAVRSLGKVLAEAELLSEDPPPLSLSTHLRVLLTLFLASIPLTAVPTLGRGGIVIALVAGWAFWGLEQASEELGGVFGGGANHIPIRAYSYRILDESLRTCPPFERAYSARVRLRTGLGLDEDASADERTRSDVEGATGTLPHRGRNEEWLPSF